MYSPRPGGRRSRLTVLYVVCCFVWEDTVSWPWFNRWWFRFTYTPYTANPTPMTMGHLASLEIPQTGWLYLDTQAAGSSVHWALTFYHHLAWRAEDVSFPLRRSLQHAEKFNKQQQKEGRVGRNFFKLSVRAFYSCDYDRYLCDNRNAKTINWD